MKVTSRFCPSLISTLVSPVDQGERLTQRTVKSAETSSGKNNKKIRRGIYRSALLRLLDSSIITSFLLHVKRTG